MKQAKKIWNGVNVKIRDFLASLCFSGPSFLGMLMFFVAPFCVVIYYSFIAGALDHSFVGLKNYINVWNNGAFQIAVKNTAVFSGLSVPLAVVLALVLGAITETNLRQALIIDNNNFGAVISHPISAVILVLAVLLAFGTPIKSLITKLWAKKKA